MVEPGRTVLELPEITHITHRGRIRAQSVADNLDNRATRWSLVGVHKLERRLDASAIARLVADYEAGQSLAKIGQRFGCAHTVVRKALIDAGVALRPRQGWDYS